MLSAALVKKAATDRTRCRDEIDAEDDIDGANEMDASNGFGWELARKSRRARSREKRAEKERALTEKMQLREMVRQLVEELRSMLSKSIERQQAPRRISEKWTSSLDGYLDTVGVGKMSSMDAAELCALRDTLRQKVADYCNR